MAQVNYNQPAEPRGGGDGNAGIYAILVIIAVLIVGAVLYFSGVLGERTAEDDINADIDIECVDELERHKETGKLRRFIPLPQN